MRLADESSAVAGLTEDLGHRWCIDRERHAVHPHAVGGRVLAGQDGRAGRHAHHGLRVGPLEPDALGGQAIDDRGPGQRAAVAPERVVALLIGGDQEDVAAHHVPLMCRPVCDRCRPARVGGEEPVGQVGQCGPGGPADHQGQRRRLGVGAVDDQARSVAEVVDIDRAQVLSEHGCRDPVLQAPQGRVHRQQALRHGQSRTGDDGSSVPFDRARLDPGEPLGETSRVSDQGPDVVRRRGQPHGMTDAPPGGASSLGRHRRRGGRRPPRARYSSVPEPARPRSGPPAVLVRSAPVLPSPVTTCTTLRPRCSRPPP